MQGTHVVCKRTLLCRDGCRILVNTHLLVSVNPRPREPVAYRSDAHDVDEARLDRSLLGRDALHKVGRARSTTVRACVSG
jgi:hypothetical protein